MSGTLFGTDGIRGKANSGAMTAEMAMKVGMAAGQIFKNGNHRHRAVIGKDTRLSGYALESAMMSGFTSAGIDVFLLGPMPTPAVAMLTRSLRADLGVMISASHNPYYDNGIKIFGRDGFKLSDEIENEIEALLGGDTTPLLVAPDEMGRAKRVEGSFERYIEYAKRTLDRSIRLDGLKVVIDCANGAGYRVAPQSLWELGADVTVLGVTPDGFNINLNCGSTSPDALCRKVRQAGADIGIALDGDADRVIIVDENGTIIDGDQLLAAIAESWKADGRLVGGGVVATVMSNLGLERFLESQGLELLRTQVGDRYVVERMRAEGYNLGGEQSGHIVMTDHTTTGDGLVTALQILAVVVTSGKPVSEVCKRFAPVPQLLKNVATNGGKPLEDAGVKSVIEKNIARLGKHGRLLIRPSGTEPVIRVMAECDDEALVSSVVGDIAEALETASAH
ncbi:MAG: phosphoglucosamine mutase [Hyphomicrobiales bacterium]|nr:phosphoglucosamine mutase [Hyphomicrobiales bacterium]